MRIPDLRTANTIAPSRITMSRAHRVWVNTDHQNPGAVPGATRNSSRVAAAAPRLAGPAERRAALEPVATMSLRYAPGLAPAGTTSSTETRMACFGASCTTGAPNWIHERGTGRPCPLEMRCTLSRIDSGRVPALTTDTPGRATL